MSTLVAGVARGRPALAAARPRYDALVAALCGVFQAGAYLDVWAHVHRPELETFFTPWHAVLYSGFFAVAAATVVPLLRGRGGQGVMAAAPPGYALSVVGVLLFFLGGILDMLWHTLFGIEVDVEALLSPSHLVLALGSTLMLTGPLRAGWRRLGETRAPWPALLSLAYLLSAFSFWTQYAHPLSRPWPAAGNRPTNPAFAVVAPDPVFRNAEIQSLYVAQALGVASILLQAALLSVVVLLALRRWRTFPPGAFTVVFALNALMLGVARDEVMLVVPAALAGVVLDTSLVALGTMLHRRPTLRAVAFAAPAAYFALLFSTLALTRGVWWGPALWSGTIVLAGAVGWLLSWLVWPPPATAEAVGD